MITISGEITSPEGNKLGELLPLSGFSVVSTLSKEDKLKVINQADIVLEGLYAHLPLKAALFAVDPIQELRLLESRIEAISDLEFHRQMIGIFLKLRDRHTSYRSSFTGGVATLPFRIERCFDGDRMLYVVSDVFSQVSDPHFVRGVEVTHWNGIPIARAVEINGERMPGANPEARRALGELFLTQRPLGRFLPPDESWVQLAYLSADTSYEARFAWVGLMLPAADLAGAVTRPITRRLPGEGLDEAIWVAKQARRALFAPKSFDRDRSSTLLAAPPVGETAPAAPDLTTTSALGNFEFRAVTTPHGTFGYIRIFDFEVDDAEVFLNEFVRILKLVPQNGLIIDIRDNPGGYIKAGQLLLQTLTPFRITPGRFHFRNTRLNREMCERNQIFANWLPSERQAVATGATFSQGYPIEDGDDDYNRIGQQYHGPVVLITSALSYSTSDIVTADFYDHGIGKVLGVDTNIGAGGANNWSHDLIKLFNPGFQLAGDLQADLEKGTVTDRLRDVMRSKGVILSGQASSIQEVPAFDWREWQLTDAGRTYIFRRVDWMNDKLNVYFDGDASPVQYLPNGVILGYSARMSTRTHLSTGLPLEDLGVEPDAIHKMTVRDVLQNNDDLIADAANILSTMRGFKLIATIESSDMSAVKLNIETANLDRLDVYVNDRPIQSIDIKGEQTNSSSR